jgi:hypothetical protein
MILTTVIVSIGVVEWRLASPKWLDEYLFLMLLLLPTTRRAVTVAAEK